MSSVGTVGNEQFSNALLQTQQLSSAIATATLKRSQDDSSLDSGIPAKRAVMHGIDGSLVQMGGPYLGQMNEVITEPYPVPENTVGLVIGKGGSEIQSIQTQSGCRVQMSPDSDNSGFRQVTLQGNRASIEKAKQLINDVVMRAQQRQQQNSMFDSPRATTIEIQIPASKCGLIIGKQGDTIRQLQEQAGCKMLMIQESQEVTGMPKPLRITGEPEKIEIAKRLVSDLLSKEGEPNSNSNPTPAIVHGSTARGEVVVPREAVGMIIGKGGDTIKKLGNETGTKIQFKPDEDPTSPERCAVVMGTREQILHATRLITDLVNKSTNNQNQQQEVFYMHIPANKTGLVIGKGGETIKQINAESGAHCELSRDPPPNPTEKIFIIKGTPAQINNAQHIIRIKVGDVPPNTPVPMMNAGAPMMSGNNSYAQAGQFNGQYGSQPAQQQWGGSGQPGAQDTNVWNQQQFYGSGQNPVQPGQFTTPQYQQPAAGGVVAGQQYAQPQATGQGQPVQAQASSSQPTINPATGQPDYSAQWAEYYRNVGLLEQAAMVESQMKQNAAARAAAAGGGVTPSQSSTSFTAPYQTPTVTSQPSAPGGGQPYTPYQTVGNFPQTGQFQTPAQPQQF